MSFVLEALRDKPLALYMLDDDSPFQDYSGFNRSGTASGTPAKHISLVKGADYATVFSAASSGTFAAPVFNQNHEEQTFCLEAWVIPVVSSGEQQVLGNLNQMDGLVINGTVVSFVTKYLTATEARASYDLQTLSAVHLVGIHTKDKNSLFVNGVLVAEVTLTEEQQADSFAPTNGSLYSGANASTGKIAVNGLAAYAKALSETSIVKHFSEARAVPVGSEVLGSNSGDRIPLSLANANLFLDQWWSTADDWNMAELDNVAVLNDQLVPQFDGDTSISGSWIDTFVLSSAGTTSIYGVSFDWDGEGAVIEASLDGDVWTPVVRGQNISIVPEGFDPTDKVLLVRASFPGGIVDDPSYLDNLNAVGVVTAVSPTVAGRTVTLDNATQQREHYPLALHSNWGVEVDSGGTLTISQDASGSASPARTLELWIKRTGATAPVVSMTGTTYIDGAAGSTIPQGQWVLMHIVASADVTGSIVITGPAQVGQVGIYETALSASEVEDIYSQYTGTNVLTVGDNSVVGVTNSPAPVKIYAHDWSIQSAG